MPPPQPPLLTRVCSRHGLVAGLDGRCVICHRSDAGTGASGSGRTVLGVALACAALVGGVLVLKGARGRQAAPPAVAAAVASAPAPPAPPPDDPPPTDEDPRAAAHRVDEQKRVLDVDAEMFRVPITMYVDDKCDLCATARDWMKEKGLHWSEVDVGTDTGALAALKKRTASPSVPSFDVGGELLEGFGPSNLLGAVRRAADRRTP